MNFREKTKTELKAVCTKCGKPIGAKAESNVTRYLSFESRCQCENSPEETKVAGTASNLDSENSSEAEKVELLSPNGEHQSNDLDSASSVATNLGDRYEVQSLLGRGGMGAVYKCRDKELQKTFAIKVLNANLVEDKSSVKRFEQEAQAASGLTSPNLVAVYDYGMGKTGSPYIVMDYLDGTSLDTILKNEGYLDCPRSIDIFIQICDALTHAHTKDVIHRDVKPSNIMITQSTSSGAGDFVKLVDFGIAKVLPSQQTANQNLTQTGDIFGSPLYMSPEQCLGNKLDARSDIYALGCVMYETLTGHPPFEASNPIKIILKHVNDLPTPISKLSHDFKVPKDLETIVMRCLEKEPQNRYQSAEELARDLQRVRDGKAIAKKAATEEEKKRHFKKVAFRVFQFYLILIFIGSITYGYQMVSKIEEKARRGTSTAPLVDPIKDANNFDNLSYQYFVNKDYEKAIPLLQFGLSSYKGKNPYFLADNYNHLGKCYKELGKYELAAAYYEMALKIYGEQSKIHGPGFGMESEARSDYADVLKHLNNPTKAAQVTSGAYTPTEAKDPAPNIR